MHPDAFIRLRPYAYHLTARANLPAIEHARRNHLHPSPVVLRLYEIRLLGILWTGTYCR
mgnify:CR=1 FL=1